MIKTGETIKIKYNGEIVDAFVGGFEGNDEEIFYYLAIRDINQTVSIERKELERMLVKDDTE